MVRSCCDRDWDWGWDWDWGGEGEGVGVGVGKGEEGGGGWLVRYWGCWLFGLDGFLGLGWGWVIVRFNRFQARLVLSLRINGARDTSIDGKYCFWMDVCIE